jgi:adenylate kinase
MVVLVLMGPPGAGKGTQAERLASELEIPHLSTGNLLREHLVRKTEIGERARGFMDRGELVPDDVVIEMLHERAEQPDGRHGFLLDGFPRTLEQARALEAELLRRAEEHGPIVLRAIELHVPDEVLVRRLAGRRTCRTCGRAQHLEFSPPRVPGRCDRCGGELYQRDDDRPEVVQERLAVYRRQTLPVERYYEERGLLVRLDGDRPPDEVFAALQRAAREKAA